MTRAALALTLACLAVPALAQPVERYALTLSWCVDTPAGQRCAAKVPPYWFDDRSACAASIAPLMLEVRRQMAAQPGMTLIGEDARCMRAVMPDGDPA